MLLSERTQSILKNFAQINSSIALQPGSNLNTMNTGRSILAQAEIEESLDKAGSIYDLPRLLSVLSMYEKPELQFAEEQIRIKEGARRTNFTLSAPEMVAKPVMFDTVDFPASDLSVTLTWASIRNAIQAASVMGLPEVAFVGDDTSVAWQAYDPTGKTADVYSENIIDESHGVFRYSFKIENMKLMPSDYSVDISASGLARFVSTGDNPLSIKYYIAIEEKSSYKS